MQKNCDFKSNRKSEAKETETGVLLKAVKENEKIMVEENYGESLRSWYC